MVMTYPRHCEQCNYTARSQQAWSQHTKTIKHMNNCGICERKEQAVATPAASTDALLAIIADMNKTIKLQAETIKAQADTIKQLNEGNRGFRGDISACMVAPQPSVTLNISDLVTPKQYSNNMVKHKELEPPEPEPPDESMNMDELLAKDFHISDTTEPEEFEAQIMRRFMDISPSKRPIRYHKGAWQYKQDDIWHTDNCERNVHLIIQERLRQWYREIDDAIGERSPTMLQDRQLYVLGSMMGDNSIQLWKCHGLTQKNCKP